MSFALTIHFSVNARNRKNILSALDNTAQIAQGIQPAPFFEAVFLFDWTKKNYVLSEILDTKYDVPPINSSKSTQKPQPAQKTLKID